MRSTKLANTINSKHADIMVLCLFLAAVLLFQQVLASTGTTQSQQATTAVSHYESIRALDESGQAVQLKHAQAAATKGRLIMTFLVVQQTNDTTNNNNTTTNPVVVYVVSPVRQTHHYLQQQPQSVLAHSLVPKASFQQQQQQQQHFLLCTGLQSDAYWLRQQLREYVKRVQYRYEDTPRSVVTVLATIVRALFWGHEAKQQEDEQQQEQPDAWQSPCWPMPTLWGRPIGVRTLLVSSHHDTTTPWKMHVVEPSGVVTTTTSGFCIIGGKDSSQQQLSFVRHVRDALQTYQQQQLSLTPERLLECLQRAWSSSTESTDETMQLQVEVLDQNGNIQQLGIWTLSSTDK